MTLRSPHPSRIESRRESRRRVIGEDWIDGYRLGLGCAVMTIERCAKRTHPAISAVLAEIAETLRAVSASAIVLPATRTPDGDEKTPQGHADGKGNDGKANQ